MKRLPTWVEVDLDRLIANIARLRELAGGVDVLLTIKADAYGHGAVQVARAASGHVRMFGVATVDEARELREAGVDDALLVLSPVLAEEIPAVEACGCAVSVSSRGFAEALSAHAVRGGCTFVVHVEVDTGMGRTGIAEEYAREEIARIAAMPGLELEGVYTHFPVSDTDPTFTRAQLARFGAIVEALRTDGVDVPLRHAANSGAIVSVPESHLDMVRPGLLAFGLHPSGEAPPAGIEPILQWKSRIARVRRVPAGRSISYGRDFVTARDSIIGVVPVGYGHGYPFRMSGGGEMLVGGRRVPVVGRVTMDMTMVDLTDLDPAPRPGDEVVLVGRQGEAVIDFHDVARRCGTIGYEVMCGISRRVPRTYFRRGRVETFRTLLGLAPGTASS